MGCFSTNFLTVRANLALARRSATAHRSVFALYLADNKIQGEYKVRPYILY
jgi:hypothetical protein